ncbi:MAG: acyclic terpene utilization AtuA family protein, partial [Myxococcota bacterium]
MALKDTVRVGGASGFWGESALALPQLVASDLDFLVFDYLAEITMSILARARSEDPSQGYARDFVHKALRVHLPALAKAGIKVVSNAGGVNPEACGEAIRSLVTELDLDLRVAVISGDDLSDQLRDLATEAPVEMFSGARFPDLAKVQSVNAYLGAFPIAAALREGADIVVTGRVVDSAVTLGACIYAFDWGPDKLDELAGASLAGHILECTSQATGGNFTDWEDVAGGLLDIGYPIAEISRDGSFTCTKPEGTGGQVRRATVAEQLLYEVGDPGAYVLPDVVCDLRQVRIEEVGPNRVRVTGAQGHMPPSTYKVSATFADGFRGGNVLFFYGFEAARKARTFGELAVARAERRLEQGGLPPFEETLVEIIGDESHYGAARRSFEAREVAVKIAAKHPSPMGIEALLRETIGAALGAPPGLTLYAGGRPKPSPVVRLFSFRHPKERVSIRVELDGEPVSAGPSSSSARRTPSPSTRTLPAPVPALPSADEALVEVPLIRLAWARSGDKGDKANIGVIARRTELVPYIWAALTEPAVA